MRRRSRAPAAEAQENPEESHRQSLEAERNVDLTERVGQGGRLVFYSLEASR